jgi:predicted dehydrogenase
VRNTIRLVIVGAGVIGSHHGKVINELANEIELTGVVDIDLAKAQSLASSRGGAAFVSLKDALAQAEFEAVADSTPPEPTRKWQSRPSMPAGTCYSWRHSESP